jgi:hypothetical protein
LQGPVEVLVGVILLLCFLIPGVLFYIVQEGRPYCSGCGRRAGRAALRTAPAHP